MALPLVLAVHQDDDVLDALRSQLGRYDREYRVECVADPEAALELLADAAERAEGTALVLGDATLWDLMGGEGLERVRRLHPHAKRALLVEPGVWADELAVGTVSDAIGLGRIDHYVIRPVEGLDEAFHQAVTGFLLEWATDQQLVPQTIHVVGERWSGRAFELREVLAKCAIPHAFCLADSERGQELIAQAGPDAKLPLVMLPDGSAMGDPSNAEMAAMAGAPGTLSDFEFDVVIVGAGPAGLSAAVYGASEGLETLVIDEGGIGGQARSSSLIRNFLGFPRGISGSLLAEQAYEQASVFGTNFLLMHRATTLERTERGLRITVDDGRTVNARTVVLATGAHYTRLGVPDLEDLLGAGVFYGGAASEAHALAGKDAFVVGGGNSAGQAALHLARYARQVTVIIRRESLDATMSHYLIREIEATANIDVRPGTTVVGGTGDGRLEELVLRDAEQETTVPADALFVLIGARPHTEWLPDDVARDSRGFLRTGDGLATNGDWSLERPPMAYETSMPGVLAAGDVRDVSVKRVASAVGEGSIAIQQVHALLAQDSAGLQSAPAS